MRYELIAIGASWGGLRAVSEILGALPEDLDAAVVIAQHRRVETGEGGLAMILGMRTRLAVRDADDKEPIEPGHVYLAPPDYHLLVERGHFVLSIDEPVNYARPSIDVLFDSVAEAYAERAIGVILTGANEDGAAGLALIKRRGGVAIVQDPRDAEAPTMPTAALAATGADAVLRLAEIGPFLHGLCLPVGSQKLEGART
jgi:two-component system, chemotaxis family, protein-glutamate methylesterase/glutaminase